MTAISKAILHLKIGVAEELEIYFRNQLGNRTITTLRGPASISITKKQRGSESTTICERIRKFLNI